MRGPKTMAGRKLSTGKNKNLRYTTRVPMSISVSEDIYLKIGNYCGATGKSRSHVFETAVQHLFTTMETT
jgi:hypothetical protein